MLILLHVNARGILSQSITTRDAPVVKVSAGMTQVSKLTVSPIAHANPDALVVDILKMWNH